jgi:hypothetical protein
MLCVECIGQAADDKIELCPHDSAGLVLDNIFLQFLLALLKDLQRSFLEVNTSERATARRDVLTRGL